MNYTKDDASGYIPPSDQRPLVTVDVVIFTIRRAELQVLLVKRAYEPYKAMWALPGGFVHYNESLEDAALRELKEETGAEDVYLEQLFTFGEVNRDPRARVVSVAYFALVSADKLVLKAGSDAAETAWHNLYNPPSLAFDHAQILKTALERLRNKIEYAAVAFQLLPEEFTLRELQDVYTIILNDPELDKRNFRKKLLRNKVVVPTQNYRETGGRPAQLYRFADDKPVEIKARRLFP